MPEFIREKFKNFHLSRLFAAHVILFILSLILVTGSIGFKRDSPTIKAVSYLTSMEASVDGGPFERIELPHNFTGLAPGTSVTLRAMIHPTLYDSIYVKTVYSKAKIYLNNNLVFTMGRDENYPSFMLDPAAEIHIVESYGDGSEMELKIEYQSPQTIPTLIVKPPMIGSAKELILERSLHYGFSWSLALAQIISGIALLLISLCIIIIDRKGVLFTWLGLFAIATGFWFFGANDFAITVFPNSTFLYLSAFIGFTVFFPTLIRFIRINSDITEPAPLCFMEWFSVLCAIVALALQFLGIYPLHKSKMILQVVLIPCMIFLTILMFREAIRYRSKSARRLIVPLIVLTTAVTIQLVMRKSPEIQMLFPPVQFATLFFLFIVGIVAGISVKSSMDLQKMQKELAYEKKILDIQTAEQRENRLHLAEKEKLLSRQRHDLRHHLTAIRELADEHEEKLNTYLDTVMEKIPAADSRFCENGVVNAIISHFASVCEQQEIEFEFHLMIPETGKQEIDSDLCVIFANMLENATEACGRMKSGKKFIKLNTNFRGGMLTITMDNSFNGLIRMSGDQFYSSKRDDVGIGLSSIHAIAKARNGSARFENRGTLFMSSVYLRIS